MRLDLRGKFYCVGKFSVVCINAADVKTIIKCDERGPPFCNRNNFTSSGHRHNDLANFAVNNFLHISGSVFLSGSVYACTHTFVMKLGPMSGMSAHLLTALGPGELGKAPHRHFPQAIKFLEKPVVRAFCFLSHR